MFGKKQTKGNQLPEMLGITSEKCDEIIKTFVEKREATKTWSDTLDAVKKTGILSNSGDFILLGYLFGRAYEQMNPSNKTKFMAMVELLSSADKKTK